MPAPFDCTLKPMQPTGTPSVALPDSTVQAVSTPAPDGPALDPNGTAVASGTPDDLSLLHRANWVPQVLPISIYE